MPTHAANRSDGRPRSPAPPSRPSRPAEADLLRLCARTHLDEAQAEHVRGLARGTVEWGRFVQAASNQMVLPLVTATLQRVTSDEIPPEVASSLVVKARSQAMWNMTLGAELLKLLAALRAEAVPAIGVKGAALALLAYGNLALRPFTDFDILVRPEDVAKTVRVLESFGYPGWDARRDVEQYIRGECEETFVHPTGRATVDLHWALSRGYLPFPVPFETLLARAQPVRLGAAEIPTLGDEDLLLFLCLHGGKHAWERLVWVCDIAELLRARPRIDLDALLDRAAAMGNRRLFLVALELARSILDVPLPPGITEAIRHDSAIPGITRPLREKLLQLTGAAAAAAAAADSSFSEVVGKTMFHLRMLDRPRDRLAYLIQAAVPNPRDRDSLSLPPALRPLYFVIRPIRLLTRYGLARFRPS